MGCNEESIWAVIGKFLSPHGVAGMIKVFPYSDFPERCYALKEINIRIGKDRRRVIVEKASLYGRLWLIKLQGIETREDAGRVTGGLLEIPVSERMPLAPGIYYHDQIVGLQVYNLIGEYLGEVVDISSHGGHDLYLVEVACTRGGKRLPVPAVKEMVKEIDLSRGRMVVELPEGLDEL